MEQVLGMGMEEGLTEAVGQIDAILAEDASRSHRRHTMTTMTEPTTHTLEAPGRRPDLRHPPGRLHRARRCS